MFFMSVANIRRSYDWSELQEHTMEASPIQQLEKWLSEAIELNVTDPTAMTLATADANGQPSARIVLLKEYSGKGLVFFTNYESRKANNLKTNSKAAILFYWPGLERQIRIEGTVTKVPNTESDTYFKSRPLSSQHSAWASPQSHPISRDELEARMEQYSASLGQNPERPHYWGGYVLQPNYFEFWQGRANRLHDRITYTQNSSGEWLRARIAP